MRRLRILCRRMPLRSLGSGGERTHRIGPFPAIANAAGPYYRGRVFGIVGWVESAEIQQFFSKSSI